MNMQINGGKSLSGRIVPSGNKNAVLPMLCATLLTDQQVTLENVPELTDVAKLVSLMEQIGSKIDWDKGTKTMVIDNKDVNLDQFAGNLPLGMRASILMLAPMLARFGKLSIDFNIGGCSLGMRDVDPHIYMLEELGAKIDKQKQRLNITLNPKFRGAKLWPDYASVTGTENALMAAALADGETTIYNAACEPHVQNLCELLVEMGAEISGIGSNLIIVNGVNKLNGAKCRVMADHHEITTFLALGAMTGGRVEVEDALPEHFPPVVNAFAKLGVEIKYDGDMAYVEANQSFEPSVPFTENYINRIEAAPWPYFPADLLPLMVSLSLLTNGITRFWNKVYEGGLFWTSELTKFNAKIDLADPHRLIVVGPTQLKAAPSVDCPQIIRATVALVMASLAADGTSTLKFIDPIYRAHPDFAENLKTLGAQIEVFE